MVETSGTAGGATTALHLLRAAGQGDGGRANRTAWPRLIFQANYLDEISINPYTFFPGEGVTFLAPFDRGVCDRLACVEYHRTGVIHATDFVDQERPYQDAPAAYHEMANRQGEVFSTVGSSGVRVGRPGRDRGSAPAPGLRRPPEGFLA